MVEPDSELERKIRQISGCQSLKRGETFTINASFTDGDGDTFQMLECGCEVYGSYTHVKIIHQPTTKSKFEMSIDSDRHLNDEQKDYIFLWALALFLWGFPELRKI